MEMKIHFKTLPEGMDLDALKCGLDEALEEDGWLTGSEIGPEGGYVELELEDERHNPKYGIIAVKNHLKQIGVARDTKMELAGLVVGVYE